MKRRFSILLATCLLAVGSAGVANAADNVFEANLTNRWKDNDNWSLGHDPEDDERAIIPAGEDCVIHAAGGDAVAESFYVLGTLTIEGGRKLTITANSSVGGVITIEGAVSTIGELVIDGTLQITGVSVDPGEFILAGGKVSGTRPPDLLGWTAWLRHARARLRGDRGPTDQQPLHLCERGR